MNHVEAVVKVLQPGFNVARIAAKRRNKSNPWFKRGTLFRSAVDVMRRAGTRDGAGNRRRSDSRQGSSGHAERAIDLWAAILAACGSATVLWSLARVRQRTGD